MRGRFVVVAIFIFALFAGLVVQYFRIQVVQHEKWAHKALVQHEIVVTEPYRRGSFFAESCCGKMPLVFDVTKYHLYIDPLSIPESLREECIASLIPWQKEDKLRVELERKSRSRRLAMWLTLPEKERVLEWWLPFAKTHKLPKNALYFVTDYQRSYPHGKLMGQLLHTIREMKDEATNEGVPTGGLEAYFNKQLKGIDGKRVLMRSPLNKMETERVLHAPQDGADVYLTIDPILQAIVEEELELGVKACRGKGGWAVLMEAKSGEIKALAHVPFFEPTNYRTYFNDPSKIEETKVHAITDAFELGSIMKPFTMALCLLSNEEKQLFDPDAPLNVRDGHFPGRGGKPLRDLPQHKVINMDMALQKSSNIYMARSVQKVVEELGSAWYRQQLVEVFGFGVKTGVELPAEAVGMVPTPGKYYASGAPEWSAGTPYVLSIGYNLLATSLQMCRAMCVFANDGYLVKPTLIKKVVLQGKTVLSTIPETKRVLPESIARRVVTSMKYSTKPGGTGRLADLGGYTVAGKTGTAEKIVGGVYSKQKYISSFIGFAPAKFDSSDRPLVLMVSIDEPEPIRLEGGLKNYLGGRCAAPIFKQVMQRAFEYMGYPPDDPGGYPVGDPRYDVEHADWIGEVRALKQLYEMWN